MMRWKGMLLGRDRTALLLATLLCNVCCGILMRVLYPNGEWTVIECPVPVCLLLCVAVSRSAVSVAAAGAVTRFTTSCQQHNTCQDRDRSRCLARNGSIKPTDHCYLCLEPRRHAVPILHPDDRAWFNCHRRGTNPRVQRSRHTEWDAMSPDQATRGQDNWAETGNQIGIGALEWRSYLRVMVGYSRRELGTYIIVWFLKARTKIILYTPKSKWKHKQTWPSRQIAAGNPIPKLT